MKPRGYIDLSANCCVRQPIGSPKVTNRREQILVPHTGAIEARLADIAAVFGGRPGVPDTGDFSLLAYPLPKIALGYIFYREDEDFPAAVTCLYSSNAGSFLPMDALADVGEYTSRKIINLINE